MIAVPAGVRVLVWSSPGLADERIEIALPGGVAVRVGSGFDAAALHRVLTVLGR